MKALRPTWRETTQAVPCGRWESAVRRVGGLARPECDEAVGHGRALLFLVYGGNSWGFFEKIYVLRLSLVSILKKDYVPVELLNSIRDCSTFLSIFARSPLK